MMSGPYYSVGRYWGKITQQALGESKEKKTPFFAIRFIVTGKVDPADPQGDLIACEQYERTLNMYLTEGTIEFVTRDLEKLGFQGDSFKYLDPSTPGFHDFTGVEGAFYCSHEEYEGKAREKWSLAKEGGTKLEVEPLESKQVRALDNLFGKHLKGLKKAAPKSEVKQPEPVGAGAPPSDDIPF
jgi:hypothetical protein